MLGAPAYRQAGTEGLPYIIYFLGSFGFFVGYLPLT
jgi:hypothetical protein